MRIQHNDKPAAVRDDLARFERDLVAAIHGAKSDAEAAASFDAALAAVPPTVELVGVDSGRVLRRVTLSKTALSSAPRFHVGLNDPVGSFAGKGVSFLSTVRGEYQVDEDSGIVLREVKR
jgi:hypothetical protein